MEASQHGGNWAEYGENSRRVLDFSANISPLGVPWRVRRAITRAAGQADRYPDPRCRRLREAIAESAAGTGGRTGSVTGMNGAVGTNDGTGGGTGMSGAMGTGGGTGGVAGSVLPNWILCGNGAADLIYRVAQSVRPKRAVLPAPTFSEYETALLDAGCTDIARVPLLAENGFQPGFSFFHRFMQSLSAHGGAAAGGGKLTDGGAAAWNDGLANGGAAAGGGMAYGNRTSERYGGTAMGMGRAAGETGLAFLCQPNNPTGTAIPKPMLLQILDRCRETGFLLVLDECFLPFMDRPEAFSLADCLNAYDNLLILRAFTKLYGMAGVRLGYALSSNGDLLYRMARCGAPWSVSSLAQEAGMAALQCGDYVRRVRELVARERPRLHAGLDALGLHTIPGEANFLLFRSPAALDGPLWERGIVLRNCGNFPGLDQSWYRTAVRTGPENRRLLSALGKILRRGR